MSAIATGFTCVPAFSSKKYWRASLTSQDAVPPHEIWERTGQLLTQQRNIKTQLDEIRTTLAPVVQVEDIVKPKKNVSIPRKSHFPGSDNLNLPRHCNYRQPKPAHLKRPRGQPGSVPHLGHADVKQGSVHRRLSARGYLFVCVHEKNEEILGLSYACPVCARDVRLWRHRWCGERTERLCEHAQRDRCESMHMPSLISQEITNAATPVCSTIGGVVLLPTVSKSFWA